MNNDFEHIRVEFMEQAKTILFRTLKEFQYSIKKLNRNLEENRFNQLKEQHVLSLKTQLEIAAQEFLQVNQNSRQLREMDHMMQQFIRLYLHHFVLRTRFL